MFKMLRAPEKPPPMTRLKYLAFAKMEFVPPQRIRSDHWPL